MRRDKLQTALVGFLALVAAATIITVAQKAETSEMEEILAWSPTVSTYSWNRGGSNWHANSDAWQPDVSSHEWTGTVHSAAEHWTPDVSTHEWTGERHAAADHWSPDVST
eukprot:CAMPEP_0114553838 /NCGR_PEP_ID=MMETSP0114-20121206/7881_1 /TAXON_ID=31324 /ORGANISM="Goniomonas sp, Strain m" /LENGTH=109 /DNA_ID=CAMNT_0001738827 /DNA_START=17 /DNA_END=342 /DNA_ORIENTATION=+